MLWLRTLSSKVFKIAGLAEHNALLLPIKVELHWCKGKQPSIGEGRHIKSLHRLNGGRSYKCKVSLRRPSIVFFHGCFCGKLIGVVICSLRWSERL